MPKKNKYACSLEQEHVFDNLEERLIPEMRNPSFINYSPKTIRKETQSELLQTETELTDDDLKEVNAVNDEIKRTLYNQSVYILREVAKLTDRSEELEKDLAQRKTLGKLNFPHLLEVYRFSKNYDEAIKTYSSKNNPDEKEPVWITKSKLNPIIEKSCLEENIGAPDLSHDDVFEYNISGQYKKDKARIRRETGLNVIKSLGYTKEELDDAFTTCFYEGVPAEVDTSELKDSMQSFIQRKLHQLPENERDERAFVKESEKLEVAMRCYVFPHNQSPYIFSYGACGSMSNSEYYDFANDAVSPLATAKTCKDEFHKIVDNMGELDDGSLEYEDNLMKAANQIKHLKQVHSYRPLWTRFKDYFRSNGEDSTIKRLTNELIAKGYPKDKVKDAISLSDGKVNYTTVVDRGNQLIALDSLAVSDELKNETTQKLDEIAKVEEMKAEQNKEFKRNLKEDFQKDDLALGMREKDVDPLQNVKTDELENENSKS